MLVNLVKPRWWYMEIPRTGSSTMDRVLRQVFPTAEAIYPKHWPIQPEDKYNLFGAAARAFTTVRNPYSRAVSCWQYFTRPGEVSFHKWTEDRLCYGFRDVQVEAQPQAIWLKVYSWDRMLRQENLDEDFYDLVGTLTDWKFQLNRSELPRFNDINGPWVNRLREKTSRDRPWQDYYCPQSIENVRKIYADDFWMLSDIYQANFPGDLV